MGHQKWWSWGKNIQKNTRQNTKGLTEQVGTHIKKVVNLPANTKEHGQNHGKFRWISDESQQNNSQWVFPDALHRTCCLIGAADLAGAVAAMMQNDWRKLDGWLHDMYLNNIYDI